MNCPNCRTETSEGAKFCMNCGSPLPVSCGNCGTMLPPEAKFCLNCGRPVGPAPAAAPAATQQPESISAVAQSGERRVVTVMFADISGFTAMSERMDPEQVRSLMNKCFDRLVPIITKYEGVVDKFIGDAIMALFGAPVAHEDDPARALYASLEMMTALEEYNADFNTTLGVHIGVNTGLVVAGGIGSQDRREYSVMGDTVNLAARLEDASESGEILLGPDTHRMAAALFDFEQLEPIQVKGKVEPVQIYRLIGRKAAPGKVRGLAGLESQMVGRDGELAALVNLTDALRAGLGRAAFVIGEPGLGKSRLIAEWRKTADGRGEPLFWAAGQCLSYGQGLAYHLLIDLVRSLIGVPAAAGEQETQTALASLTADLFGEDSLEVFPYLGHLLSLKLEGEAQERVQLLDPQALQAQYLAAMRRLLQSLAGRQPLVLIFEDIHWADPSSTDLLVKLLPLVVELPLLFCFVSRAEQDVPGWKLVGAARDLLGSSLTELNLHSLTDEDSRALIANLLEIEALPEEIRTLILARAEGNPFFVEEVIRMLIDRGAIVQENGRWASKKEIETVEIPDNLQGLLLARIDRLPDDVKHTLRVASVIGRQFSVKVLEEVLRSA